MSEDDSWWQATLAVSTKTAAIEVRGEIRTQKALTAFIEMLNNLADYLGDPPEDFASIEGE